MLGAKSADIELPSWDYRNGMQFEEMSKPLKNSQVSFKMLIHTHISHSVIFILSSV
jgi:hypothetical protein